LLTESGIGLEVPFLSLDLDCVCGNEVDLTKRFLKGFFATSAGFFEASFEGFVKAVFSSSNLIGPRDN